MTPTPLWSSSTLSYASIAATNRWGFVDEIYLLLLRSVMRCWLNCMSPVFRTPNLCIQIEFLFVLFLLVLRLLAEITLVDWLIVLHKITRTTAGVGVTVTKEQHP
jgi:hypothetical protein